MLKPTLAPPPPQGKCEKKILLMFESVSRLYWLWQGQGVLFWQPFWRHCLEGLSNSSHPTVLGSFKRIFICLFIYETRISAALRVWKNILENTSRNWERLLEWQGPNTCHHAPQFNSKYYCFVDSISDVFKMPLNDLSFSFLYVKKGKIIHHVTKKRLKV